MSLPMVLREAAQQELEEGFDHYEGKRAGLGADFVARVQAVFDRIAVMPLMHAVALADVRKAVVTRFPYVVYYRPHDDRIEVLSVFHSRRDPAIWQARV